MSRATRENSSAWRAEAPRFALTRRWQASSQLRCVALLVVLLVAWVAKGCSGREEYALPDAPSAGEISAGEAESWSSELDGVWFVDLEASRRLQANREDAELLRELSRDGSWRWVFLDDGSFESRLTIEGRRRIDEHGNWRLLAAGEDVADIELRIEGEGEIWRFFRQAESTLAMFAPEGNTLLLRREEATSDDEMQAAASRSLAESLLVGRWRADAEALAEAGLINPESSRPDAFFELEFRPDRRFFLYLQLRQADISENGGWRIVSMDGRRVTLELIGEDDESRRESLRFPDRDTLLLADDGQELRFERIE